MSRAVFSTPEGVRRPSRRNRVQSAGIADWYFIDGPLRPVHRVQSEADAELGSSCDARSEFARAQLVFNFDL